MTTILDLTASQFKHAAGLGDFDVKAVDEGIFLDVQINEVTCVRLTGAGGSRQAGPWR